MRLGEGKKVERAATVDVAKIWWGAISRKKSLGTSPAGGSRSPLPLLSPLPLQASPSTAGKLVGPPKLWASQLVQQGLDSTG